MNKKIAFALGSIFFVLGLTTLPHYGINWDTVNHLPRGQAYLHFFLMGKKDYSDLQRFFYGFSRDQWYWQNPSSLFVDTNLPWSQVPERSMYQIVGYSYNELVEHDGNGHPPLSDILSALFNRILFGRLKLINDVDSYRVYGVFLAASLVGLVYYWSSKVYGKVAGLISAVSLSLYPLFWSESHFNTEKDIPEAVFWSWMLFSIWKGLTSRNWKWIVTSGIFMGLALGTKFNIVFSIFVVVPWVLILLIFRQVSLIKDWKLWVSGLIAILIGGAIFIGSWPYLWADLIARIAGVINFYRDIGTTSNIGVSYYPLKWILYTTPLVTLAFLALGLIAAILKLMKERDKVSLLFLLWLGVPIARVIWPGASVYGGIRQIMEYIPAVAILAGLGAQSIYNRVPNKITLWLLIMTFIPITLKLISIHPNENVYFNSLIGGLAGAKKIDFPYWGFSFGNPYRQGVMWVNEHAEKDSHVVYAYELIPNFPRLWLRPDLVLHNNGRSGYLRRGEYAITLIYQGIEHRSYYDEYLNKFISPAYQVKVDGVPILTIWKNDDAHLISAVREERLPDVTISKDNNEMIFDLGKKSNLSRLEIDYDQNNCSKLTEGYVYTSLDKINWNRRPGTLPDDWRISALGEQPNKGRFIEPFVGESAQFVKIYFKPEDTCLSQVESYNVFVFK